jgi:hypothetical protein
VVKIEHVIGGGYFFGPGCDRLAKPGALGTAGAQPAASSKQPQRPGLTVGQAHGGGVGAQWLFGMLAGGWNVHWNVRGGQVSAVDS